MKTIEERAKGYSLKDFDGYYTGRENAVEEGYIAGAKEQNEYLLEEFDKWLCRNSWITRDEDNRKPLGELREIFLKDLGEAKKADKVSKLEVVFDNDNESAVIYINGERCDSCLQVGEVKRVCRILTKTVRHFISTIYD